jgi:hypothetical protein
MVENAIKKCRGSRGASEGGWGQGERVRGDLMVKSTSDFFLFAEFFESDYIQKSLRYPSVRKKGDFSEQP